jgi:hypothetical protein
LVPKKNQRRELIEQAGGLDGGRDQDEERGEQSNPPVHHLEQLVKMNAKGTLVTVTRRCAARADW